MSWPDSLVHWPRSSIGLACWLPPGFDPRLRVGFSDQMVHSRSGGA